CALPISFYCEKHPASIFNKGNIISLKTKTGRKTIAGMIFRVFDGDAVKVSEISDNDMLRRILCEHFGIKI
ncbi:MAG: arylamine N-acetyltransferase, partial [Eubacteriales bacterium]|nr:arylamine N-acetyltransferase [Eubacteriales bacterium]